MLITNAHYQFYLYHKVNVRLFDKVKGNVRKPSVHSLIPTKESKKRLDTTLHNTIAVLKIARKHGDMLKLLTDMSTNGNCIDARRREVWCKRWLRKINNLNCS